jgi:hypothetical protein
VSQALNDSFQASPSLAGQIGNAGNQPMQQFASVAVKVRSGATAEGRDRTHLFPLCADSGHAPSRLEPPRFTPSDWSGGFDLLRCRAWANAPEYVF